jgi:hypothetical protein
MVEQQESKLEEACARISAIDGAQKKRMDRGGAGE